MLHRHRRRIGRLLASVMTLVWLTLALQPCASAQESFGASEPVRMEHHMHAQADHHHGMIHQPPESMGVQEEGPCAPGSDCPVFEAVDAQAAVKAADPFDLSPKPAPVLLSTWRLPLQTAFTSIPRTETVAHLPVPAPPILEFRVLLI